LFAEDIEITKGGRYALVTDGGFSSNISTIEVVQRTMVYTGDFSADGLSSQAVAMGAYNTVLTVDYFSGAVNALVLDATGQLTVTGAYTYLLNTDGSIHSQSPLMASKHSAARPAAVAGSRPKPGGAYPDTESAIAPLTSRWRLATITHLARSTLPSRRTGERR